MNKVMLIGNVGIEPKVRYFDADQAVATLRLATNEKGYTLPNGTVVPDKTDWHDLVFYRRLARVVERYVHKGDKLYVEGKLQYRTFHDKRGMERTVCEILVESMELLTPKQAASGNNVASAGGASNINAGSSLGNVDVSNDASLDSESFETLTKAPF